MNIQIKYKDAQNWTTINGDVVYWGDYYELFKDARIVTAFAAPEVVTENWNGKNIDIQHKRYDVYCFEFLVKEAELNEINKLQSCSEIIIKDLDNDIEHILNVENFEHVEISEPEPQDVTTIYKVSIKYRINETVINKYTTLQNKTTIICGATYYSKFDKIDIAFEPEKIEIDYPSGIKKTLRETKKNGYKVLLFLSSSEFPQFLTNFLNNDLTIDGVPALDKKISSDDLIGVDLHRVELEIVTSITQNTYGLNTGSYALVLTYNGDTYTYYTDYPVLQKIEDAEFKNIDNENGYKEAVKIITRHVQEMKLFLNNFEAYKVKEFFANGDVTMINVPVLEKNNVEIKELDYELNEVTVVGVVSVDINYPFN